MRTAELTGAALDWAVAKAEGYSVGVLTGAEQLARQLECVTDPLQRAHLEELFHDAPTMIAFIDIEGRKYTSSMAMFSATGWGVPQYSRNIAQAWQIIEREGITVGPHTTSPYVAHYGPSAVTSTWADRSVGPTSLVAAMRCYLEKKLGAEIDIPDELVNLKE